MQNNINNAAFSLLWDNPSPLPAETAITHDRPVKDVFMTATGDAECYLPNLPLGDVKVVANGVYTYSPADYSITSCRVTFNDNVPSVGNRLQFSYCVDTATTVERKTERVVSDGSDTYYLTSIPPDGKVAVAANGSPRYPAGQMTVTGNQVVFTANVPSVGAILLFTYDAQVTSSGKGLVVQEEVANGAAYTLDSSPVGDTEVVVNHTTTYDPTWYTVTDVTMTITQYVPTTGQSVIFIYKEEK